MFGLTRGNLGAKKMKEFAALRAKTYISLTESSSEGKRAKGTKKCVIKRT